MDVYAVRGNGFKGLSAASADAGQLEVSRYD
jgi:hypothetical protein